MSNEAGLNAQEQQVESLLEGFAPRLDGRVRDRLMFQAGRRSAGHVRRWQGISGVLTVLLIACLAMLAMPERPVPPEPSLPLLAQHQITPVKETIVLNNRGMVDRAYIRLRSRVLTQGLEALPESNTGRDATDVYTNYGEVLKRLNRANQS